jgi:hypothetical protein
MKMKKKKLSELLATPHPSGHPMGDTIDTDRKLLIELRKQLLRTAMQDLKKKGKKSA